jgi:D-glycero-D-manno-heptose 1,7-bisphosphate phosphatase
MHSSALFLDRDGVINVDRGYIHRPDQFEFVPGIFELARFWTNELRGLIVVVTNQSWLFRRFSTPSDVPVASTLWKPRLSP